MKKKLFILILGITIIGYFITFNGSNIISADDTINFAQLESDVESAYSIDVDDLSLTWNDISTFDFFESDGVTYGDGDILSQELIDLGSATAHEDNPFDCVQPLEVEMDITNNAIGLQIAQDYGVYTDYLLGVRNTAYIDADYMESINFNKVESGEFFYIKYGELVSTHPEWE